MNEDEYGRLVFEDAGCHEATLKEEVGGLLTGTTCEETDRYEGDYGLFGLAAQRFQNVADGMQMTASEVPGEEQDAREFLVQMSQESVSHVVGEILGDFEDNDLFVKWRRDPGEYLEMGKSSIEFQKRKKKDRPESTMTLPQLAERRMTLSLSKNSDDRKEARRVTTMMSRLRREMVFEEQNKEISELQQKTSQLQKDSLISMKMVKNLLQLVMVLGQTKSMGIAKQRETEAQVSDVLTKTVVRAKCVAERLGVDFSGFNASDVMDDWERKRSIMNKTRLQRDEEEEEEEEEIDQAGPSSKKRKQTEEDEEEDGSKKKRKRRGARQPGPRMTAW